MVKRHKLAVLSVVVLVLTVTGVQAADKFHLKEKLGVGDQWQIALELKLAGDLLVRSGDKITTLNLSAVARHQFPERALDVDAEGKLARVARHYDVAQASITVHGATTQRTLRPERRLQVAQVIRAETVTYAPYGPLTREEHELTGQHLDTLAIAGLLPSDEVELGESWEPTPATVQAICGLDGLISHELKCKLSKADATRALISISGPVVGITGGSEVTIEVAAELVFDPRTEHWTSLDWKQKEERTHGPVSPASKTEATTTVRRTFPAKAESLADGIVNNLPATPDEGLLYLIFRDAKGRWEFLYDRNWHVVAQTEQYIVLRVLDRGELVGQLNVTPLPRMKPGQHISVDELRKIATDVPGLKINQILQTGEVPAEKGHWIYRISVAGQSDDTPVVQNFYAVAGPEGEQVLLSFTTEVAQVERLGGRDLAIVSTVSFPSKK